MRTTTREAVRALACAIALVAAAFACAAFLSSGAAWAADPAEGMPAANAEEEEGPASEESEGSDAGGGTNPDANEGTNPDSDGEADPGGNGEAAGPDEGEPSPAPDQDDAGGESGSPAQGDGGAEDGDEGEAPGTAGPEEETDGPAADPGADADPDGSDAPDDGDNPADDPASEGGAGTPASTYTITYHGADAGLSSTGEDLFAHFGMLVPGERGEGSVVLENASDRPCDFYLHANQNTESSRPETADAFSRVRLSISSLLSGETIYEGTLQAADLAGGAYLGTVDPGESIALTFAVEIPSDLGNEFALSEHTAPWVFAAQEIPENVPAPAEPEPDEETPLLAKTGSYPLGVFVVALVALALAAAVAAFAAKAHAYLDDPRATRRTGFRTSRPARRNRSMR